MNRPINIRVIDFETSDLPENGGKIIEIGYTDLNIDLDANGKAYVSWPMSDHLSTRFGLPRGMYIDPAAKATHGIWEDDLPLLPLDSLELLSFLQCEQGTTRQFDYLVAHNAEFERQMLAAYNFLPGARPPLICTMKVARRVWPRAEKHTLPFLRYYTNLERGKRDYRCDPAHAAGPDTWLTAMLFAEMFSNFHVGVEEMRAFTIQPEFHAFCPLGKYKGREWSEVDKGYLAWIIRAPDMEEGIKTAAKLELNSRNAPRW
jgi:exodeoxyribonuclease X